MRSLILCLFAVFLLSCNSDKDSNLLNKAEKMVEEDASKENVAHLIKTIITEYETADTKPEKIEFLKRGLEVAQKYNLPKDVSSFRLGLITQDPSSESTGKILLGMADQIKERGKTIVADIMYTGISKEFESLKETAIAKLSNSQINIDTIITQTGQAVFDPENPGEVNRNVAHQYVDMCEAYGLSNPSSDNAVEYLFKGAEMARSLKSYNKSISLFDMVMTKYPETKKAASALFVKAFMMENDFKRIEEAKELYVQFLEQYPEDELADDVEVLLNNLGKTDEELYNSIRK